MGESKRKLKKSRESLLSCAGVQTVAGRIQVKWATDSAATPMGQLAYFIEFLTLSGLWERWVDSCPLEYKSGNASTKSDILGTWLLSILSGHKRYAHVTAIRSDGVNPGLLGMNGVVAEDTLRRALQAIPGEAGVAWLDQQIDASVAPLLDVPWILDTDTTVKPIYGKQEGAAVSYNPRKPGRPSHNYHNYLMAGLRLEVAAEVHPGNEHTGSHALPGLLKTLDRLPIEKRPALVRGDCGFGSDGIMKALEARDQRYLFKLKLTKKVKQLIERMFSTPDWVDAGQGWEGQDSLIKLTGWERHRRVVILRRPIRGEMLLTQPDVDGQQVLGFIESTRADGKRITGYEHAVLVTDLPYEVLTMAQLYRDRADAENAFDELKNQWGWGGFTTQDLHRCQLSARAVALIYNWWSLFVRLAHPDARKEAITSRPWLLSSVGIKTEHAGQTTVKITGIHAQAEKARYALLQVSALLKGWFEQAAEQFASPSVWTLICQHIKITVAKITDLRTHHLMLMTSGAAVFRFIQQCCTWFLNPPFNLAREESKKGNLLSCPSHFKWCRLPESNWRPFHYE